MKESFNKLKVFFYSALGLSLLSAILFTISMFIAFDSDIGYFSSAHILPTIQAALIIVSVLFFASIAFIIPKNTLPREGGSGTSISVFASLFCGIVFIIGTAIKFLSTYQSTANMVPMQKYLFVAIIISGLISAAYFIYEAFTPDNSGISSKVISGIFVIVNFLATIVFEHIDYYTPINAPRKVLLFIGFASASMFMVQEFRRKTEILLPRAYIFFGSTTILVCAAMSISGLVAHYAGAFKCSSFLVYYLIGLALAIYASAKIFTYISSIESNTQDTNEIEE